MRSLVIITFEIILILCNHLCECALSVNGGNYNRGKNLVVIVDQSGNGNFTKVQDAVNFIPVNNKYWAYILVRAGVYNEKVNISEEKPLIVLQGDGRETTVIQSSYGGFQQNATFSLFASHFVARNITFKNVYDHSTNFIPASAAVISGSTAAFFDCGFESVQDTITDSNGRHYFESCYIQGAVDFIWGGGQSIYKGCTINVTYGLATPSNEAFITAQARSDSKTSSSAFVFIECSIVGSVNLIYLGRAYTNYSKVLFYKSNFETPIAPQGWLPWNAKPLDDVYFAEEECKGVGADKSKRVWWEKKLSQRELELLVNVDTFINRDRWIDKLPSRMVT